MKKKPVYIAFFILDIALLSFSLDAQNSSFSSRQLQRSLGGCANLPIDYKIWKTGKSEDDYGPIYLSFVSLREDRFNTACASEIAKTLKKRLGKNSRVKAFLFDNENIAKAFSRGKFHPQELSSLMRGIYYYDKNRTEEYIKFSPEKGQKWDKEFIKIQE